MKNVKIKYNPFLLTTEILVDGKQPKGNSSLNFGKLRIQEWASSLPKIIVDEYKDKNLRIEFTGTPTDFEDLKIGLEDSKGLIELSSLRHNAMPEVDEVEKQIDEIFIEILNGPVEEIRDKSIIEAFKKAKSQEFIINVVATMSSGKSSLINAILEKKLMPVAEMAETATIVSIIDTEQDNFKAIAFDANGNKVDEVEDITYKMMKEWNYDENISTIDIYGRIPCVSSVGMRLTLVDTPGPNNSRNPNHEKLTYEMLSDSDKSLVLFVLNSTQLGINDENKFMDYVSECMRRGGKQSRERYIFVVNKLDMFNPEDDSPKAALSQVRVVLEDKGIDNPNIFPASAQVCYEARTKPQILKALPAYKVLVNTFDEMKFDEYYSDNHLSELSRRRIESYKEGADEDTMLEIHSGVVSVEEAIRLYINKYARSLKVYDLVMAFNNRLNEVAAISKLKDSIQNNEEKKKFLTAKIEMIKKRIEAGQTAKIISGMIGKKNLVNEVKSDINQFTKDVRTQINDTIVCHKESNKVPRKRAVTDAKLLATRSNDLLNQLDERIDGVLTQSYKHLFDDIMNEYNEYLEQLGLDIKEEEFAIKPINLVVEEVSNIDDLIKKSTKEEDEGQYEKKERRESYQEKKTNWLICPWQWGTNRYETKYRTKIEEVWVPNNVEYVNMYEVVTKLYQPVQEQIVRAQQEAVEHAKVESERLKKILERTFNSLTVTLKNKLSELEASIQEGKKAEEEIIKQKNNLVWMESIINRVNKLIKY